MHNCLNIQWTDVDGCTLNDDDFITITVSGMKYETLKRTLQRFPRTLLGDEKKRCKHFVQSKNYYFFDRNRMSFEAILYFYQSGGILTRPGDVPMHVFEEEVVFFQLGDEALLTLHEEEGFIRNTETEDNYNPDTHTAWQSKLWLLFEYPDSSTAARAVSAWSMFVIGVSITVFCLETLPVVKDQVHQTHHETNDTLRNHDDGIQNSQIQPWFSLEVASIAWFTLEYIVRLISSPSKWKFLKSFLNIIDYIIDYIILWLNNGSDITPLSVLRVVRLVRVFRIFKLSRHSMSLQILGDTLRASVRELAMLIFFLFLGIILFSSALYYAENGKTFKSIPDAFWYSLVTMTTVGYGEIVPVTFSGKLIGSLCTITGVLTISLPVPVIVSNFQFFYKRDRMVNANKKKREELNELKCKSVNGDDDACQLKVNNHVN